MLGFPNNVVMSQTLSFQVQAHKTFDSSGYARVILLPDTVQLMDLYATKIRNCLPLEEDILRDAERPFFLTYQGEKLGHLRNMLTGFWKKTALGGTISMTKLRKSFTTMVSIPGFLKVSLGERKERPISAE